MRPLAPRGRPWWRTFATVWAAVLAVPFWAARSAEASPPPVATSTSAQARLSPSQEDLELARYLDLLEHLDLLENLELFELMPVLEDSDD